MYLDIEGCSAAITAADGYVASPGYGATGYANFITCTWEINSGNGRSFILVFEDEFWLEEGVDFVRVRHVLETFKYKRVVHV